MSIYEDKFNNHPLHENLDTTTKRLEAVTSEVSETEVLDHLTRLVKIVSYAKSSLSNLDPSFVPESILNQLDTILTNINGDLGNFESDKGASHLVSSNSKADNLLIKLHQLTKLPEPSALEGFTEYLAKYHKSIDDILSTTSKKKDAN